MIKEWLEEYKPTNYREADQALREIMQEIALGGLQRSGFFEVAAFYGGTALRIFHGLPRFSEDLDFSLKQEIPNFTLAPYLKGIKDEFSALGIHVNVTEKEKSMTTAVDSAFLKAETEWKELFIKEILPQESVKMRAAIKIKLEVDTKPPAGFATEQLLLTKPFSFYTTCFTLPHLFAGKMHALLFRKWKGRVKGRDWFDFAWYVGRGTALSLEHLALRAKDSGDWPKETMNIKEFTDLLMAKIAAVKMEQIKQDVIPFIPEVRQLDIWSPGYFMDLAKQIKYEGKMKVTAQWSDPVFIEYGRTVRIFASPHSVAVKIYNTTGISIEKTINLADQEITFPASEIAAINPPMMAFLLTEGKGAYVEYQYMDEE